MACSGLVWFVIICCCALNIYVVQSWFLSSFLRIATSSPKSPLVLNNQPPSLAGNIRRVIGIYYGLLTSLQLFSSFSSFWKRTKPDKMWQRGRIMISREKEPLGALELGLERGSFTFRWLENSWNLEPPKKCPPLFFFISLL